MTVGSPPRRAERGALIATLAGVGALAAFIAAYAVGATSIEADTETSRSWLVTVSTVMLAVGVGAIQGMVRSLPARWRHVVLRVHGGGLVALAGVGLVLALSLGYLHAPGGPGYADSMIEALSASAGLWLATTAMTLIDSRLPWLVGAVGCVALYVAAIA